MNLLSTTETTASLYRDDATARDRFITDHLPLVKRIAYKMAWRLPVHVDRDDLVSAGVIGLVKSVDRYDPGKGVSSITFLWRRIRGAIFDSLKPDLPTVDTDDVDIPDPSRDFLSEIIDKNEAYQVKKAMDQLTEKQRLVICKYYFDGLTMKSIGQEIGKSESAVSLIHKSAIRKLRNIVISRL